MSGATWDRLREPDADVLDPAQDGDEARTQKDSGGERHRAVRRRPSVRVARPCQAMLELVCFCCDSALESASWASLPLEPSGSGAAASGAGFFTAGMYPADSA